MFYERGLSHRAIARALGITRIERHQLGEEARLAVKKALEGDATGATHRARRPATRRAFGDRR